MLWEESRMVPVEKGLFDVILGEVVPINLLFNNQYWLGITINTGSELEPRTKLSSVAYSLNTKNIVDSSITTSKIVDGAITSQKIDSNAVVKSLNGLKDSVNLVPGTNVTITPSGNNLTISATPGGGGSIGGSGTANYSFSSGFLDEDGTLPQSRFRRASINLNSDFTEEKIPWQPPSTPTLPAAPAPTPATVKGKGKKGGGAAPATALAPAAPVATPPAAPAPALTPAPAPAASGTPTP